MVFSVSIAVQKCYRSMATNKCKENEIRHFCKYHGKSVERRMDPTEEEVSRCFLMKGDIKTPGLIQACVGLGEGTVTSCGTNQCPIHPFVHLKLPLSWPGFALCAGPLENNFLFLSRRLKVL